MALTATQQRAAAHAITARRVSPAKPVPCPSCGQPGLQIADRSARPHAEWYALRCPACGLNETLHIALGAPVPTLD